LQKAPAGKTGSVHKTSVVAVEPDMPERPPGRQEPPGTQLRGPRGARKLQTSNSKHQRGFGARASGNWLPARLCAGNRSGPAIHSSCSSHKSYPIFYRPARCTRTFSSALTLNPTSGSRREANCRGTD
jgi:hypothetical protein